MDKVKVLESEDWGWRSSEEIKILGSQFLNFNVDFADVFTIQTK